MDKGGRYGAQRRAARSAEPVKSPTGLVQTSLRLKPEHLDKLRHIADTLQLSTSALIAELIDATTVETYTDPETGAVRNILRCDWSAEAPAALPLSA